MRKVVLVGGGHAHVQVLRRFARRPPASCRLTLVVDQPLAIYSGMVPGYVAGRYALDDLTIDLLCLARQAATEVVRGRAVEIYASRREIALADGTRVPYDLASFDIGATVAGLDVPGVRDHAVPIRPIHDFVRRIEEIADRASGNRSADPFRVILVGGGAGGMELAFALERRLGDRGSARAAVTVVESGPRILPDHPDAFRQRVSDRAQTRGIGIQCGAAVTDVTPSQVRLAGGGVLHHDALVWVAGAASQGIFRRSKLPTDGSGFASIRSTLQVDRYPDIFAAGDCATLLNAPDTPKAGVYAVRQGPVLARNLRAKLTATALDSYRPQRDALVLLNLADGTGIGTKWGRAFAGRWVMHLKDWIDRRWMRQFHQPRDNARPTRASDGSPPRAPAGG